MQLPLVTVVGPTVAFLVTGAFIVETFYHSGDRISLHQAIGQRDYPVIRG
jgi:ABC-type dipeptide/oligopeptide/nickel transport system permease component